MTRARLLAETDAWELALWQAKWRIDGPMTEMQTARLLAHFTAYVSGQRQRIRDHLPPEYSIPEPEHVQSIEEQKAVVAEYLRAIQR